MKILHLTLTKHWFDMIYAGEKPEEYREIKWHWIARLSNVGRIRPEDRIDIEFELQRGQIRSLFKFKKFDAICFTNGYSKNAPQFLIESQGIEIGIGNEKWGATPNKNLFILKVGRIISTQYMTGQSMQTKFKEKHHIQ